MGHQLEGSSLGANTAEGLDEEICTTKKKSFPCKFCKQKFSTSQALGGHQNAHKKERSLDKFRKELNANCFGLPHFPPYSYPTLHEGLYRSSNDSLNPMLSNPWTTSTGFGFNQRSPYFDATGNIRNHAIPESENNGDKTLALLPSVTTNVGSHVMNTQIRCDPHSMPQETSEVRELMTRDFLTMISGGYSNLNKKQEIFKVESSDIDLSLRLAFNS